MSNSIGNPLIVNADTLDGLHADSFVQQAGAQRMTNPRFTTWADTEAYLEQQYEQLSDNSKLSISLNCVFGSAPLANGTWAVELVRTGSDYGFIVAMRYDPTQVAIRTCTRWAGVWGDWYGISGTKA